MTRMHGKSRWLREIEGERQRESEWEREREREESRSGSYGLTQMRGKCVRMVHVSQVDVSGHRVSGFLGYVLERVRATLIFSVEKYVTTRRIERAP